MYRFLNTLYHIICSMASHIFSSTWKKHENNEDEADQILLVDGVFCGSDWIFTLSKRVFPGKSPMVTIFHHLRVLQSKSRAKAALRRQTSVYGCHTGVINGSRNRDGNNQNLGVLAEREVGRKTGCLLYRMGFPIMKPTSSALTFENWIQAQQ